MRRSALVAWASGSILVAVVGAAAFVRSVVHDDLETGGLKSGGDTPRLDADDIALIKEEIRRIDAASPLEACGTARDAADVLNVMIGLDGPSDKPLAPPWWSDPDVAALLKRDGSNWWDHVTDGPRGDVSVTHELLAYDHWTLPEADPQVYPDTLGADVPIANVVSLQTLAKLRLLEGIRSARVLPALTEVRHLASLLTCGNSIVDTMVALSLLIAERQAYDYAVQRGMIAPDDWHPVPESLRREMRHVAWSLFPIEAGWVQPGLELPEPPAWVRCAVLQESLLHASYVHAFVGERLPGEYDQLARYRRLHEQALAATSCRLDMGLAYYDHPWWNSRGLAEIGLPAEWWQRLPYQRDLWVYIILWRTPGFPGSFQGPPREPGKATAISSGDPSDRRGPAPPSP